MVFPSVSLILGIRKFSVGKFGTNGLGPAIFCVCLILIVLGSFLGGISIWSDNNWGFLGIVRVGFRENLWEVYLWVFNANSLLAWENRRVLIVSGDIFPIMSMSFFIMCYRGFRVGILFFGGRHLKGPGQRVWVFLVGFFRGGI